MGNKMCGRGGRGGEEAASYIDIPQDLWGEILYRLPSNDLLNFKRVSKDWLRLISSKAFIQKHLQRSKADYNHLRILLQFDSAAEIIDCANNTSKRICFDRVQRQFLGCCDGLVLYYDHRHHKIAAFNPCTGDSLLLVPLPNQYRTRLGRRFPWAFSWFGHHPSTGEYVLVLAYVESKSIKLEVYSVSLDRNNINLLLLSSSTLDELGLEFYPSYRNRIWTSLHGRLHCRAIVFNSGESGVESVILVYDFETNKITRMTPPVIKDHNSMMLGVVDGCLCAIQSKQVWMMKEYGVEESWTQYAKLDGGIPLAFCPDGDVVSITGDHNILVRKVSKYNLREREKEREAKILCETTVKIVYGLVALGCVDSLVSPTLLWRKDE